MGQPLEFVMILGLQRYSQDFFVAPKLRFAKRFPIFGCISLRIVM
jgi:hypothetical protein